MNFNSFYGKSDFTLQNDELADIIIMSNEI